MDERTLRAAATRFRAALDRVDPAIWQQVEVSDFPRGACGHASELLGRYLRETLAIEPLYVLADFYNADGRWRGGHAWLEFDGLIVDITGDQFGWDKVTVTRESLRHAEGRESLRHPLSLDPRWRALYAAPVYVAAAPFLGDQGEG